MLTEDIRILAGLQESKTIENPLPQLIKEEQQQILREKQRIIDEQKTVVSHFDLFEEKMSKYNEMMTKVMKLFESNNRKEFVDGLFESKYSKLQRFADIVINEGIASAMTHLEKNYYHLKEELDKIEFLIEADSETNSQDYFVSDSIFSQDKKHNLNIRVYKNKDLEEKVSNEISYGSQIISLGENLAVVKDSGKKYYTTLSPTQLKELEKKGFLI
jgi:hypothetical protein